MRFSILDCYHERTYAYCDKQTYTEDTTEIATLLDNASRGTAEVICLSCFRDSVENLSWKEGMNYDDAHTRLEGNFFSEFGTPRWVMLNC